MLRADNPMTVRQVFYQAVSRGLIAKTEAEYKQTIGRLLTEMRLDGTIPFGWIADNTRWMRKPETHSSLKAVAEEWARSYRRAIWQEQEVYVEVWLEKEALAGVLYEETHRYDVPLMVTRGYPSLSYVHEAPRRSTRPTRKPTSITSATGTRQEWTSRATSRRGCMSSLPTLI
jgi:hypothetical protein